MPAVEREGKLLARLTVDGSGTASVETGISVLDHLLVTLARYGSFDLTLQVAGGAGEEQVAEAGEALGETLRDALRAGRGHASAMLPAEEALAAVSLDVSDRPELFSNVDLSSVNVAGLGSDLVAGFLGGLARAAGLTLHVRLLEGDDEQHVLEAIFRALGAALGSATHQKAKRRRRKT